MSPAAGDSRKPTAGYVLALLAAAGPVCYGAGLWAASLADGRTLGGVVCFDTAEAGHRTFARLAAAVLTALGAALFCFVVPWVLGMLAFRRLHESLATAVWSLAANSAVLVLVCLVLRNTVGIHRTNFFAAWLAWTAVLLAIGSGTTTMHEIRSFWRRWAAGLAIGAATVTLTIVLFHREYFLQCFNGDGTEQSALAHSLRHHFLPYWEIEAAGRFGTYMANPTVICSYWTLPCQLLLGNGELAARMPFWIWSMAIFAVSLGMSRAVARRGAWLTAVPLALMLLMFILWYTFYVGYYPYMADLASPGVLDAMFTLLLLLGLDCLRRSDFAGWAIASVLASLLFYAGWVFFLLTAVAAWLWQPRLRRQITTAALGGAVVLVVILGGYLLVGWAEGSLWGWWSTLQRECFHRHFAPGPRLQSIALFAGYFLLGCGVVPAAGVLRGFRKKQTGPEAAWRRTVTSAVLAYLLIVMLSGNKNLHYLGPLLPIPLILWLKHPGDAAGNVGSRWAAPLSATAGLAVCIFICWPAARPVFTLNRQLGSVTTFRTDSYEEACRWGRLAGPLFDRGDFGWQIGEHTWVGYSQLDAEALRPRPLLVTDRDPPSEDYRLVLESTEFKGARLYSRDRRLVQWLSGRRPPTAAVRFPPVFRPIAPRETCRGAIGTTEETFLNSRPPGRRRLPGPSRR